MNAQLKEQPCSNNSDTRLERWYVRAKIAGVVTFSVVAVLAYTRINKSLDTIDATTKSIQPAIWSASRALNNIERGTGELQTTLRRLKPAFQRVPKTALYLERTLKGTRLTMQQLRRAAANAQAVTGKINTLLTPQALNNPQVQQAIQVTTASIASGISSATPQTPSWTPGTVIAALAQNPTIISAIIQGWRTSVPSVPTSTVPNALQKSWRFLGWFRKK